MKKETKLVSERFRRRKLLLDILLFSNLYDVNVSNEIIAEELKILPDEWIYEYCKNLNETIKDKAILFFKEFKNTQKQNEKLMGTIEIIECINELDLDDKFTINEYNDMLKYVKKEQKKYNEELFIEVDYSADTEEIRYNLCRYLK